MEKFYTGNRFGLLIDLRTSEDQTLHGSGTRLVNSSDGVLIELQRKGSGSGDVYCHVFVISDAQMNIQEKQLESVQY